MLQFKSIFDKLFIVSLVLLLLCGTMLFHRGSVALASQEAITKDILQSIKLSSKVRGYIAAINTDEKAQKLATLQEFYLVSETQNINSATFQSYLREVKVNLDQNKIPSRELTNQWLSSFLFNTILHQEKLSSVSIEQLAPFALFDSDTWTLLTLAFIALFGLNIFCIGYLTSENRHADKLK